MSTDKMSVYIPETEEKVEPMMVLPTPRVNRREKIKELKTNLKEASDKLTDLRKQQKEANKEDKLSFRKDITELVAVVNGLSDELKLTIMNRLSSSSFEWKPTGINRRQRRMLLNDKTRLKRPKGWDNERDTGHNSEDTADTVGNA